jgi:all-trans-8'-apo-beta-carotenal 15,15'-oxygenase
MKAIVNVALSIVFSQSFGVSFLPTQSSSAFSRAKSQHFSSKIQEQSEYIVHRDNYDGDAWVNGFQNPEEGCYELKGGFPTDLQGTFFQNGHAKFYISDDEFHVHPFDADGMIQAVTFKNGKAWFRNRYIQTPGYLQELKEQKVCFRGIFGTARNKGKWYSNIFDTDFK